MLIKKNVEGFRLQRRYRRRRSVRAGTEADGAARANFWKIGAFPILFQKFAPTFSAAGCSCKLSFGRSLRKMFEKIQQNHRFTGFLEHFAQAFPKQ